MSDATLWWAALAGVAGLYGAAVWVVGRQLVKVVERSNRDWQRRHWARQTAFVSHPHSCPTDVIEWISEPVEPPDRIEHLPVLSFQRCAIACGHDPAEQRRRLLNRLQTSPRANARGRDGATPPVIVRPPCYLGGVTAKTPCQGGAP